MNTRPYTTAADLTVVLKDAGLTETSSVAVTVSAVTTAYVTAPEEEEEEEEEEVAAAVSSARSARSFAIMAPIAFASFQVRRCRLTLSNPR